MPWAYETQYVTHLLAGSYTFAKTLEYKAKQGLNSSKEVTVVPPHEYQERFVSAMDDYFLACPGMFGLCIYVPRIVVHDTLLPQTSGHDRWTTPQFLATTGICPAFCRGR